MSDKQKTPLRRLNDCLPDESFIETNGKEGGLRDDELQMFYEGAKWATDYIRKKIEQLLPVEREFWIDARDTPAYLNREDYEKDFDKKYGTDGETKSSEPD